MVLGLDILLPRVRQNELITNLSERELNNPEGCGFDLRAGELYKIESSGYLGITKRETPKVTLIAKYNKDISTEVLLQPNEYYIVKIIEEISLDPNMLGIFHPRSTLFRSGVVLETGTQPAGYKGSPSFGMYLACKFPFKLEMGARIAHINILEIQGKSFLYKGQWQSGRVTTQDEEIQI